MHKKYMLILAAMCAANTVGAQPLPRLPVKTLVAYYVGEAGKSPWEQSAEAARQIEFAKGYLAGVADDAQGSVWCDKAMVKTGEIDADVIAHLKKLPPAEQNQPAAQAITKILARKFPCK
jgi:hypothetical protein